MKHLLALVLFASGEDVLLKEHVAVPEECQSQRRRRSTFVVELQGKFGLLNNRLRCLANALTFASQNDATIQMRGPWEMFVDAVLDRGVLESSGLVQFSAENATIVTCGDFFACGGPCKTTIYRRAGGQRARSRDKTLYLEDPEPVLCGYAYVVPRVEARTLARKFKEKTQLHDYKAYHQRLETMIRKEPVAKMCPDCVSHLDHTYYRSVCDGGVRYDDLRSDLRSERRLFLASDRLNRTIFHDLARRPDVVVSDIAEASLQQNTKYINQAPSAMFQSTLGAALYASRFDGGPQRRKEALATEVLPVLVDMLLLAQATSFFPTPGSTMSQTVCFWRKAYRPALTPVVGDLRPCEVLVVVPLPSAPSPASRKKKIHRPPGRRL